ncbi:hypothetical protein ACJX0J_012885 [Zea mays]
MLIAYCLLLIAYCLLLIVYCLLLIAYCLLFIAYCLFPKQHDMSIKNKGKIGNHYANVWKICALKIIINSILFNKEGNLLAHIEDFLHNKNNFFEDSDEMII